MGVVPALRAGVRDSISPASIFMLIKEKVGFLMQKDMKKFLRRMIENGGFIANGVYSDDIHYWHSNTSHSKSLMDIVLFHNLRSAEYIRQDRTGRYYPTDKGRQFAAPWYKKIFDII